MKEFRIAKCLDENGMIKEFAIFSDGSRKKLIQNDEKYGKYFEVDNELNDEYSGILSSLNFSYRGRIKDAVDMIRNGNGDCIKTLYYVVLGRIDKVVYFIDRKIGEEVRQKSLEGWKNAKFGWAIECGNKNSFSGFIMLNKKMEKISMFDEDRTPISFDNKEEAKTYIEDLVARSKYYAKRIATKLSGVEDDERRREIFFSVLNEIEEYTGSKRSIILDFTLDMLTVNDELKTFECNLDEMSYRIIQCIVE